ncbi:MAG: DUF3786 domain-containing protein, partial [Candidatus Promineifilaceae bacterium]
MSDRHLEAREKSLLKRVDQLRNKLLERDPWQLAQNIGAVYDGHTFHLEVWQQPIVLSSRDFVAIDVQSGRPGDAVTQAVLAYHLVTADGTPPTSRWIAFRELALAAKRRGDYDVSNALWEKLLGDSAEGIKAYEQLAIYYEHHAKSPQRAARLSREALARLQETDRKKEEQAVNE